MPVQRYVTYTPSMHMHIDRKDPAMNERDLINFFTRTINDDAARRNRTPEQEFCDLDVQIGDRVRLTEATRRRSTPYGPSAWTVDKEASTLEGKVLGIKVKDGGSQLRIAGFGHTGSTTASRGPGMGPKAASGGQHVWFPVENYKVEVLHKVYRITEEDRLVAAVAGLTETAWGMLTDDQRARRRQDNAVRVDRVKKLMAPETGKPTLL